MNFLRVWADKLQPLLNPGERQLALETATQLDGREDLGQQDPRWHDDLVGLAVGVPTEWTMWLVDGWIAGVTLSGWPGCMAQQFSQALGKFASLLVTSERIAMVNTGTIETPAQIVASFPRSAVLQAIHRPRFAQMGRVYLVMADGSSVAILLGYLSPFAARRLCRALQPIAGQTVAPELT